MPVKALSRLPEASQVHLEFRLIRDPAERFEMLAAGMIDLTVASLDEVALAFPRFHPGFIIFPAAENKGGEGVVEFEKNSAGNDLLGFLAGGTSEALARAVPGRHFHLVGPDTPERTLESLKSRQLRAAALWQPYLAQAQKDGAKLLYDTHQRPTTEVWVASRRLLHNELQGRAQIGDARVFAKVWFSFIDELQSAPELTLKAMAAENEMTPENAQAALQGLEFLSLTALRSKADRWPAEVIRKLESDLTFWSLSGAPNQKGAKFEEAVDPSILADLMAASGDSEPIATSSPTPEISGSPTPATPSPSPGSTAGAPSMLGGDPTRRGLSPGPALQEMNDQAWALGVSGEVNTAVVPVPSQGGVAIGCDDKSVYLLDEKNGSQRWRFVTTDIVRSTPAVAGERIFVGCNDGRLYALDSKTGSKIWSYQAQGEVLSSPLVQDGRVYCASREGTVFCLDSDKGEEIWNYTCTANITSSPALSGNILVIGCFDGGLYGLSAESGEKLWVYKTKGVIQATPCIYGGKVFVGSLDHSMHAVRLNNGQEVWKKATGGELATAAAADQGILCFGGRDTYIYGLDVETGRERWKFPTRERLCSGPTICEGIVYIGGEDKRLYVLNLDKGTLRFRHRVEGWVQTPLVWNKKVFFGCTDSKVYCLR